MAPTKLYVFSLARFQRQDFEEGTELLFSILSRTQLLLRNYQEIRRFQGQEGDWIKTGSSRGRLCHYYLRI